MRLTYLGFALGALLHGTLRPLRVPHIRQEVETPWARTPRRKKVPKRVAPPLWKQGRRC